MKQNKFKLTTAQTAIIMAILTVGGKVLGFLREMILANYYGTGAVTDAYVMAQSIANAILAGAISAAATSYMPTFSAKVEKDGMREGDLFTSRLINLLVLVSGSVFILGSVFSKSLVRLLANGFEGEAASLTAFYLKGAFFAIVFNAIVVILEAYLQYGGIFLPQLVLGYVQNISIIIVTVISSRGSSKLLILGLVIGWGFRAIGLMALSGKRGFKYSADFAVTDAVKEAAVLALPVFIGGSVNQINTLVDKTLASGLDGGSVSALNYGNLIVGVISAMTVTVMVTMLYPRMNQAFTLGDYDRIGSIAERSINLIVLITVPCTFGCMLFAKPAIRLIYERGAFGEGSTELTSAAFFYYALGLTFIAIAQIITKLFYSMHNTKTAVKCSVISMVLNVVLNLILVKVMGHAGLALATSIAQFCNAGLLYYVFRCRYPKISLVKSPKKIILTVIFSAVSVGGAFFAYKLMERMALSQLVSLGTAVILAVAVFFILIKVAGFDELKIVESLLKRGKSKGEE
ncbi:MAG: murein biosynthesis integral membrane protein MurJ [Clostridia bacterium]|nr:murein biosynthesis integral membrane protein MurJ [Clostridia bacterium]